jgi:uncharacterized membrane protein
VSKARAIQAAFVAVCVAGAVGSVHAVGGTAALEPQVQYIAIILAAVWFGPRGGALVGILCGLLVGPHALERGERDGAGTQGMVPPAFAP